MDKNKATQVHAMVERIRALENYVKDLDNTQSVKKLVIDLNLVGNAPAVSMNIPKEFHGEIKNAIRDAIFKKVKELNIELENL